MMKFTEIAGVWRCIYRSERWPIDITVWKRAAVQYRYRTVTKIVGTRKEFWNSSNRHINY